MEVRKKWEMVRSVVGGGAGPEEADEQGDEEERSRSRMLVGVV